MNTGGKITLGILFTGATAYLLIPAFRKKVDDLIEGVWDSIKEMKSGTTYNANADEQFMLTFNDF